MYLKYYLLSVLIFCLIYLVGHLSFIFSKKEDDDSHNLFFYKTTIGLLFVTILYALVKTMFNTLFLGIVCLVFIYYFRNKTVISFRKIGIIEWKTLIYSSAVLLFLLLLNTWAYFHHLDRNSMTTNAGDFPFYVKLAEYLNEFGIESKALLDPSFTGQSASFYHYFNEWFTALIIEFVNLPALYIYVLVVTPILYTICVVGFVSLSYKIICLKESVRWILSVLFIIWSGFALAETSPGTEICSIGAGHLYWGVGIMHTYISMKLAIVMMFLVLFVLKSYKKVSFISFWLLSVLLILWPTLIPAILGGTILWSIYGVFKNNKIFVLRDTYIIYLTIIFIGCFYSLQEKGTSYVDWSSYIEDLKSFILNGDYIKRMFVEGCYAFGKQLFIFSPYICMAVVLHFEKKRFNYQYCDLVYIFAFMGVSALLASMFLFIYVDGFQLFLNLIQPIILMCMIVIILNAIKSKSLFLKTCCFLTLLLSIYSTFSFLSKSPDKSVKNTESISFMKKGMKIAIIKETYSVEDEKGATFSLSNASSCSIGTKTEFPIFLSCFDKPSAETVINVGMKQESVKSKSFLYKYARPFVKPSREELLLKTKLVDLSTLEIQPFFRFVKKNKLESQIDEAKLLFLEKYKIDILIAPKESLWMDKMKTQLPVIRELSQGDNILYELNWI